MIALVKLLLALSLASAPAAEVLDLRGGARIRGRILKESGEKLFVDLGFTVLEVPMGEILARRKVEEEGSAERERSAAGAYIEGSGLGEGSVKELARNLGSSVVRVICPSKSGTGFFVNRRGTVVTNFHVVEGERHIDLTVFEPRGEGFEKCKVRDMRIVALNRYYDLAVLQVPEGALEDLEFRPAPLGPDGALRQGEAVFAIGNPQGLERTVTEGIVSTTARALEGLLYIQTTAQINPGNSGGPLFNLRGEVVGVTNMKLFLSEGLGFAIPVRRVKEVLDHREAFAFDPDNPNSPYRYLAPPGAGEKGER